MSKPRQRIAVFANNRLGLRVVRHLAADPGTEIRLLVLNSRRRAFASEIAEAAGAHHPEVWAGDELGDPGKTDQLTSMGLDFGVSVYFGHLLSRGSIRAFQRGVLNLHPALLPFNRGSHPAVWAIWDGTPNGVSIHVIDEGIDTGPVVAQVPVRVRPTDTAGSLYLRNEDRLFDLFAETYPAWCEGRVRNARVSGAGSYHRLADFDQVARVTMDEATTVGDLIRRMRAATFDVGGGLIITGDHGCRYRARISIAEEEDPDE
ncbi:MAG: formyltransferase family protein [Candidatus Nanopelagicales bacterium]|nr:formyltransferase family protein [Candidatus Nanopelagicales bacterium]MDZ4248939.1 formyltransferase family protein [Candidatus Nanopelagicales bacterium]